MKWRSIFLFLLAGIIIAVGGCGGGEKNTITITGRLVGEGATVQNALLQSLQDGAGVPLAHYVLYCVTFEDYPKAGSGVADESGYFEIVNFDAKGKAFGCFVLDENGNHIADLIFEQPETNLEGGTVRSGAVVTADDADLGTIIVDLDAKIAVVSVEGEIQVAGKTEISQPFDFTGSWKMECVKGGPGYTDPAALPPDEGPCVEGGLPIYLLRFSATDKNTGKKRYGIMVWKSEQAFLSCGGVIGVTQEDIDSDAESPQVIIDDTNLLGHFTYTPDPPEPGSWGNSCTEASGWANDYNNDGDTGDYCKDLTPVSEQLYCFANCYHSPEVKENDQLCVEEREFDWSLTPEEIDQFPDQFETKRGKPSTLYVLEEFIYNSDNVGSFTTINEWTDYIGFDDAGGNWVFKTCDRVEVIQMILYRISDTELEGDFTWTIGFNDGDDHDWCVANAGTEIYPWAEVGTFHVKVKLTREE